MHNAKQTGMGVENRCCDRTAHPEPLHHSRCIAQEVLTPVATPGAGFVMHVSAEGADRGSTKGRQAKARLVHKPQTLMRPSCAAQLDLPAPDAVLRSKARQATALCAEHGLVWQLGVIFDWRVVSMPLSSAPAGVAHRQHEGAAGDGDVRCRYYKDVSIVTIKTGQLSVHQFSGAPAGLGHR